MHSKRITGLALAACVGACSSHPTGVLGNGEFRYLCGGGADQGCAGAGSDTDLPGAIAVGSTFQIGYTPNSSEGSVQGESGNESGYEIVAASPRLASSDGDTIAALREGYVALLARHVGDATVEDFVHLRFASIRTLTASPAASVTVGAGGHASIELQALDALGAPLSGRLSCQWRVTAGAPAIAVVGADFGGSAVVTASGDGGTVAGNVHATCGAGSIDVPVTVTGVAPADAGALGDATTPLDGGLHD
jgi:hypothetical protein